jgi:uncharacterized protein
LQKSALLLAAFVVAILPQTASAQTFPKPTGRVNDFANVIDPATEAEIDHRLDVLEQKTTAEIAVATVTSLDGMSVEEYANRLFKQWGIGQAKKDNGVLVLVAVGDRKIKLEVGYGLEGILPDGLAGEIIRDNFTPRFKANDYSGGISTGVNRIADIVEKHEVLTPEQLAKYKESSADNFPFWILVPFFGIFVTIGFGMLGIGLRTKTGFPVLFGSFFGGMPLLMSLLFMPKTSLFTLFPWAIAMFATGFTLGARPSWRGAFRNAGSGGGGSSSGWTMGASGSSSSGSSSSSSSSSSDFGGGSSGGGGASGSW